MHALTTLPKRTTPLIKPSFGECSPVLVCHKRLSQSFVNSTMACEHACGSTIGHARGSSLWNRAFVKGTRSRPSCVVHLLRGGYKRCLHVFQGGQRHRGRFGTPMKEKGGGWAGGSNCRRASPDDAALGHALH